MKLADQISKTLVRFVNSGSDIVVCLLNNKVVNLQYETRYSYHKDHNEST